MDSEPLENEPVTRGNSERPHNLYKSENLTSNEEDVPPKRQKALQPNVMKAPQPIVTVQQGIKLENVRIFDPKECKFCIEQWIHHLEQLQSEMLHLARKVVIMQIKKIER